MVFNDKINMTDIQDPEIKTQSKKKKFRYYDSYISKVLKEISSESGITNNAKQQLNSILICFSKIIANNAIELTELAGKRTLSEKEVSSAVQILLSGELKDHAISEGNSSIEKFTNNTKDKGSSRQSRAGIHFPPSVTEKFLRKFDTSNMMVTNKSPIFMAAVVEYLCMEILDQSVNQSKTNNRVRLTVKDVELAVRNDRELNMLFNRHNIHFLGGSNVPYIHPVLLTRKTTGKRKKKDKETGNNTKKMHRFKPGTVSLREIKRFQKMGNKLVFAKNPFEKFVRSILSEHKSNIKISKHVFTILQYVIEEYLVNLLKQSNMAAIHTGRVKLMPMDIDFIRSITDITYDQSSSNFVENYKNSMKDDDEEGEEVEEGEEEELEEED
tara:strand:+ start:2418 stop:3569 length:1152 start_codon:yes stop_codon:yes gene_type:complete